MGERSIYNAYKDNKKCKKTGYSIVSALCILTLAIIFILFGFKIYCNNLYHNNTNVVYDSITYERRTDELKEAENSLNNLLNLEKKMNENFSLNGYPNYVLDYLKDRDVFIIYLYINGEINQKELNYKILSDSCECDKDDCFYKIDGKKIILYRKV